MSRKVLEHPSVDSRNPNIRKLNTYVHMLEQDPSRRIFEGETNNIENIKTPISQNTRSSVSITHHSDNQIATPVSGQINKQQTYMPIDQSNKISTKELSLLSSPPEIEMNKSHTISPPSSFATYASPVTSQQNQMLLPQQELRPYQQPYFSPNLRSFSPPPFLSPSHLSKHQMITGREDELEGKIEKEDIFPMPLSSSVPATDLEGHIMCNVSPMRSAPIIGIHSSPKFNEVVFFVFFLFSFIYFFFLLFFFFFCLFVFVMCIIIYMYFSIFILLFFTSITIIIMSVTIIFVCFFFSSVV
jgi:hypothetical protein